VAIFSFNLRSLKMIQSTDLNDIDSIKNVMIVPPNFVNYEELEANEEVIKDQYINFNNLGVDLISNIDKTFYLTYMQIC